MAGEVITSPAPTVGYNPPWTEPKVPDPSGTIVNAFAAGIEANRRRAQVEGQLARLSLANEKLQMENSWKEKEFGFKYDKLALDNQIGRDRLSLAQDRVSNMIQHQGDMTELASLREERLNDTMGATIDKAKSQEDGALKAQQMLSDAPYEPGTMGYGSWLNKVRNEIPYSTATKAIFQAASKEHETAARDINKAQADDFSHTMRLTDMFGGKKEWFQWPDSMWGRGKGADGAPTRWVARELTPDRKNVIGYLSPDEEKQIVSAKDKGDKAAQARVLDYKTINQDTYQTIRDGWSRINSRSSGGLETHPDIVNTLEQIPANPAQRVAGTTYNSKAGKVYWDGTNAIKLGP